MTDARSSEDPKSVRSSRIRDRLLVELTYISARRSALKKHHAISDAVPVLPDEIVLPKLPSTLQFPDVGQNGFELTGLALSGGGLRSASVSLGALQGLNSVGVLDRMDYLSTVSGGGYTGGAFVASSHHSQGAFCFDAQQGRRPSAALTNVGDTPAVQHLRDHSNFLTPRGIGDLLQDIALVVRGLVTSAFVIAPYVIMAAVFTIAVYSFVTQPIPPNHSVELGTKLSVNWFVVAAATAAAFVGWSIARSDPGKSEFAGWQAGAFAAFLLISAGIGFLWFQNWLLEGTLSLRNQATTRPAEANDWNFLKLLNSALLGSPVLALVIAFFRDQLLAFAKTQGERFRDMLARQASRLLLLVGAVILPVVLWLSYLNLVQAGLARTLGITKDAAILRLGGEAFDQTSVMLAFVVGAMLFFAIWIGDNAYSLHGLYRDRLRQAFLNLPATAGTEPAATKIQDLTEGHHPYPIFNTALNVQGSSQVNRRGRNADLFSFTPHFFGSPSTGYSEAANALADGKGIDLGTVMAISGAAAAANMGVNSHRPMAFTLAALNIRLGFWLRNPFPPKKPSLLSRFYLWKKMTSSLDENQPKVLLTDGGHVENLGAYELLRRRCKLIVVIDAEADPDMTFSSFYQLERFARIDLGARITIDLTPIAERTRKIMAANAGKGDDPGKTKGPHAALGTIHYDGAEANGEETGYLLYFKSSLTGDEPDYVGDYARRNPSFPHETTADLFYSEEQFEAYRALGFHLVRRALNFGDDVILPGRDGSSYPKELDASKTSSVPRELLRILGLAAADAGAAPPVTEPEKR